MHEILVGDRLPKRGNRLTRGFGAAMLRLFGWRLMGEIPNREKLLIIAAPHTRSWDFGVGMFAILALGIDIRWMGIYWVVRLPLMRRLGGVSVDPKRSQGLVAAAIEQFRTRDRFFLALSPEGSRRKVVPWREGFYHIAQGAQVPILMATIDHPRKQLRLGPEIFPSGDYAADMEKIREVYAEFLDHHPDRFGM